MFRDDHAGAGERIRPERRRLVEPDANRERVDLFDRNILVGADRRGGGLRIGSVFPIEHDIIGGKWLAVVPLDVFF